MIVLLRGVISFFGGQFMTVNDEFTNKILNRPHNKLEVYRLSHALGVDVHRFSLRLPPYERFEEASQMRRSSKSVSSQVVEGHALRSYKAEYVHYLSRAYASAEETLEHLLYVKDTGSAATTKQEPECLRLMFEYDILCRKLFSYTESVASRHDATRFLARGNKD
jgi:four helix bundle protein